MTEELNPLESNEPEESFSELKQQRLAKLNQLREAGVDPFPNRFDRQHAISAIRQQYFSGQDLPENAPAVKTAGRVMSKRFMGKAGFLSVKDESGQIQIYGNNKTLNENDYFIFQNIDIGDIIGISGRPFLTKTGEPSLHAEQITLLSKNLYPIPVIKERDGKTYGSFSDVETRYRRRYLDLVVNSEVRENFILRSKIIFEIRSFLTARGFLEVETPMMQSIASGAAARPFLTHHNALDMPLFMRIAPELFLKRLIVGGFEKVFELNRNFRNEGISTRHNPEFTMMELYQAYADYSDMMELTESLFVHLADRLLGKRQIPYGEHTIDLGTPWERKGYLEIITEKTGLDFAVFLQHENPPVTEARQMAASIGIDTAHLKTFWEVVDAVFSEKVEPNLIQPIFITSFPLVISPLAKNIPGNPHLVERFEPYIMGREMGNAFSELNDPIEQNRRFEQQMQMKEAGAEEVIEMDEDFIDALQVGMPPTGGLGIGIDRLIMLLTNSPSIKDVILFPLMRKKD